MYTQATVYLYAYCSYYDAQEVDTLIIVFTLPLFFCL